jgi:flagellar motor switch protein FliG
VAAAGAKYDVDTPFPGARQVAVVIAALGNEAGSQVLAHFSAPEVEAIIREVKDMDGVPVAQVSELMGKLRDEAVAQSYAVAGGLDRARELLRRSHGSEADAILEQIMIASASVPFQFLRQRRPEQIVSYLTSEHPQVIALVLAHLPLSLAASVIEGLPFELRSDVAERYAKLEAIDPAIVSEVEAALQRRVGSNASVTESNATKGGVKPLAQLLNSVARDTERGVLSDLERADPDLATAIRDLMFVFEDLGAIDDRGLQEMFRTADTKTIALALKDTSPALRDKIEGNLSKRAGEDVKEFMGSLGMVRRADVEAAQQEIVRIARKLEEDGKLVLARAGGGGEGEFI